MNREVQVRFCERFGGVIPPYLLDVFFIIQDLSKGLDPFLSLGRNYYLKSFDYNYSDCTNCQVTENIEDDG